MYSEYIFFTFFYISFSLSFFLSFLVCCLLSERTSLIQVLLEVISLSLVNPVFI